MKKSILSIITVVYNDSKGLETTINSIINQTDKNFEYIIIDGNSTDGTVDIIDKYKEYIDYWISEPDNGIYDAMNKGIKKANGNWVNFMNAGDIFVDELVLEKIKFEYFSNYTLIYGNQITDSNVNVPQSEDILKIGGTFACHQSMFFNKTILKEEIIYNLKYKIFGDYELVNRIYNKYPNSFKYINISISIFEGGGISSKISKQKRIEKYSLVYNYYGITGIIKALLHNLRIKFDKVL